MSNPEPKARSNVEILERWIEILNNLEWDKMEEVLHPEFVQEMPQSGEPVRGIENFRQVMINYPGGWQKESIARVGSSEEEVHYVMTATFNLVKVQSSGNSLWSYMRVRYPDGSDWFVPSYIVFRDNKILRRTDFFAQPFDPPAWRAKWAERMEP